MDHPRKILASLLAHSNQNGLYQKAMEVGLAEYQLKSYNILRLNPQKILQLYDQIFEKCYFTQISEFTDAWYQNELRIFVWLLVVYAYIKKRHVKDLGLQDWKLFAHIFGNKNLDAIEFQSLCLLKRKKTIKWSQQETNMLVGIIKDKEQKNKWNEIAKKIFINSGKKYFRTPKQCREQWINHLDPSKIKSKWSPLQDYEMLVGICEYGKKWSKVAKLLGGTRTQHMVKNRYNSLMKTQTKKLDFEQRQDILIAKIKQRLESSLQLKKHIKTAKKSKSLRSTKIQPTSNKVQKECPVNKDQLLSLGNIIKTEQCQQSKNNIQIDVGNIFNEKNQEQQILLQQHNLQKHNHTQGKQFPCNWPWDDHQQVSQIKLNNNFLQKKEHSENHENYQINFFFSEPAYPCL